MEEEGLGAPLEDRGVVGGGADLAAGGGGSLEEEGGEVESPGGYLDGEGSQEECQWEEELKEPEWEE